MFSNDAGEIACYASWIIHEQARDLGESQSGSFH